MCCRLSLAICVVLASTLVVRARQDIDVVIKPKAAPKIAQPKGPSKAKVSTNGVLFVLTDPADANVVIKNSRGTVLARRRSEDGQFREELPRGRYEIEVAADGYAPSKPEVIQIIPQKSEIKRVYLTANVGSIVIGGVQPDATILLNGKRPESTGIKRNIKKEENQIVLEEVPNGFYGLQIEQPGYAPLEKERVEVRGGSMTMITPMLALAVAELEVVSEPGAKVYIDNEQVGETNSEGRLKKGGVKVGKHEIQLVKDDYDDYKEIRQFEFRKTVLMDHRMTPKATSTGFSEDFGAGLGKWVAPPSGWRIKNGHLEISNSPQLGFASGHNYRDFVMEFHLKLENTGGASWAVRVKDSRNYLLFYLSGPTGALRNRFNTYIVRDNKLDLQNPTSSNAVLQDLSPGSQYTIEINVKGNKIEHKITPTATGASEPLGFFESPDGLLSIGSIGFRTVASEVFSIDDIIVQPIKR
jgi:hypothetical protein